MGTCGQWSECRPGFGEMAVWASVGRKKIENARSRGDKEQNAAGGAPLLEWRPSLWLDSVILRHYELQSSQLGGGAAGKGSVFMGLSQRTRARQRDPLPGCLGVAAGGILNLADCPLGCHYLTLQFLRR